MRSSMVLALYLMGPGFCTTASLAASLDQLKLAQAQGEGGSIGGSIDSAPASPARPEASKRAKASAPSRTEEARPRPRTESAGSFDGAWSVSSSDCGSSLISSATSQVTISGGRVIAPGLSGSVNAQGAVHTAASSNGVMITSTGRIHGRKASGTYRRSDGCGGVWQAVKL